MYDRAWSSNHAGKLLQEITQRHIHTIKNNRFTDWTHKISAGLLLTVIYKDNNNKSDWLKTVQFQGNAEHKNR